MSESGMKGALNGTAECSLQYHLGKDIKEMSKEKHRHLQKDKSEQRE